MGLAFYTAGRSKDPNTQVGAYIVSADNVPLGSGYNGPPQPINDDELDWARPNKYKYIKHAEDNAIDFVGKKKLKGSTLYVTSMPCAACMLDIVAAKIAKVIYFQPNNVDPASMLARKEEFEYTKDIARRGKVILEPYSGSLCWMQEHMDWMRSLGAFQ